jgi:hypothetical protein
VLPTMTYLRNGEVVLASTGKPITDPASEKALRQTKPHWFPREYSESLADKAFAGRGNLTARGQLVREVGREEANKIAQTYGLHDVADTRTGQMPRRVDGYEREAQKNGDNPWSAEKWNVTRQGAIVRAMGVEKAAAIARAAGSVIGATKPRAA